MEVSMQFNVANLRKPPAENEMLIDMVPSADLVTLMYVVHESQATQHELLPEVLATARVRPSLWQQTEFSHGSPASEMACCQHIYLVFLVVCHVVVKQLLH